MLAVGHENPERNNRIMVNGANMIRLISLLRMNDPIVIEKKMAAKMKGTMKLANVAKLPVCGRLNTFGINIKL